MASGGTIPNNRTQVVTFYNTTGIIEKEKGIYLSPLFKNRTSDIGREVRDVYLDILNNVAVKDQDYTGIVISSWSPHDRTLTVRGNIDDFRLVTDEGDCLNYLVVTRNVTKGNVTNTYYYGFFITEVAQAGGSSIRLSVEPDDFTNIFFLHNRHVLTVSEVEISDYDTFNARMKNCYVNRQHYDRIASSIDHHELTINLNGLDNDWNFGLNDWVQLYLFDGEDNPTIYGKIISFTQRGESDVTLIIQTSQKWDFGPCEGEGDSGIRKETGVGEYSEWWRIYNYDNYSWETVYSYSPTNQKIFLNQEDSFKYKYQYRDMKFPISMANQINGISNFSAQEINEINQSSSFDNLSLDLRRKIILSSLSFLVIEYKDHERILKYQVVYGTIRDRYSIKGGNLEGGLRKNLLCVVFPFLSLPREFKKFSFQVNFLGRSYIKGYEETLVIDKADDVYSIINIEGNADYIYDAFIAKDVLENNPTIQYNGSSYDVIFNANNDFVISSSSSSSSTRDLDYVLNYGDYLVGLHTGDETLVPEFGEQRSGDSHSFIKNYCYVGLAVSGKGLKNLNLYPERKSVNLKEQYYDEVLEAEPYSFYSLSTLGNFELVFNKNRYYESNNINVKFNTGINGSIINSFIPNYTVEGFESLYNNEQLSFTLSTFLPLRSDPYESYRIQNQAQMKNQFAVNDYNRGMDLAQHLFLSGPNAVGQQAFRRGGGGALAETANQFAQMSDELIDWTQSNKALEMNLKARLSDLGRKPDILKQTGSNAFYDLRLEGYAVYYNHYTIDEISYNSIAKFLERFGYQVNLYDRLNVNDRVGWNYIKLISFDWNPAYDIMVGQEENLRKIFSEGVTLLHDKSYLTSGHNYETILDE